MHQMKSHVPLRRRASTSLFYANLMALLLLVTITPSGSLSSDPSANDDERMTNMTNVSGSERGSQHPSSGLATWILGFVFVTIISLSSMLGLLLIPSSGITTSARTADDSPLTPEGQHDVNVMRQKNASSIRTTGINSESPVSSFVSLGSECNHGERLDDGLTMRRSSDSWMGKDGERASSSRSFSFSTSYLHNGLEGLALGSLLASSIFHLIPHAFDLIGQDREHNYLFTSLLIFAGIYCFYWSEKILILITDYQKIRSSRQHIRGDTTDMDEDNGDGEDSRVTRLVTPVSGIGKDQRDGHAAGASGRVPETSSFYSASPVTHDADRQPGSRGFDDQSIACSISQSCETSSVGQVGIEVTSPGWRKELEQEQRQQRRSSGGSGKEEDDAGGKETNNQMKRMPDPMTRMPLQTDDMIADQERKDHLAWMVIIGDGIHNLIDGLSLGAALCDSHLTGFSIAIAILFEEVPHELGDYAILVSSGMTPRRAALCNLMSASTCYIGLVIGIICSDLSTSSSNSYIFAVAGGMFLYISIFNVMTDLNENFKTCRSISMSTAMEMLFWQNLGILIGVYILYSLAQFDEKLLLQSLRIEL